jgi:hypothetical protein
MTTSGLGVLGVLSTSLKTGLARANPCLDSHHGPLEILRKPRKLSSNAEFAKGLFIDREGWGGDRYSVKEASDGNP